MGLSGQDIRDMINNSSNSNDFCDKLAAAINQNLLVQIPPNSVIIAVSGGGGSPAIGEKNPSAITCTIVPG